MTGDDESTDALWRYLELCMKLENANIWHKPMLYRPDAVSVLAAVRPGELWEIDFVTDGTVCVEVYRSNGQCRGEEALTELLADQEIPSTERKH
jgi:hypothetical protein